MNRLTRSVLIPLTYFKESCEGESPVMTLAELSRYAWMAEGFDDEMLRAALNDSRVISAEGMYCLAGVPVRQKNVEMIKVLAARLPKLARLLSRFPFIVSAGVMNSLAAGHPHHESDIDLFVITKPGRMWLVRGLLLMTLKVVRLLNGESGHKKTARVAPDFFLTEDSLDLSQTTIPQDFLMAYWVCDFYPLVGTAGFQKFWVANKWLARLLPAAYQDPKMAPLKVWPAANTQFIETMLGGTVGDWLERTFKTWQVKRIEEKLRQRQKPNALVIVSDTMLKVHFDDDKRERIGKAIAELDPIQEETRVPVLA